MEEYRPYRSIKHYFFLVPISFAIKLFVRGEKQVLNYIKFDPLYVGIRQLNLKIYRIRFFFDGGTGLVWRWL